ncbi:MAG: M1 family aminopeptidase [Bacteroidota bacterium]
MKISTLLIGLMLCGTAAVSAQEVPEYLMENKSGLHTHSAECSKYEHYKKGSNTVLAKQPSAVVRRPYDVISYDLDMNWVAPLSKISVNGNAREYSGVNRILLKIDSANTTKLTFNAGRMTIDNVFVGSQKNTAFTQPISDEFTITLASAPAVNTELMVVVNYTYIGEDNEGFYLYPKGQFVGLGEPDPDTGKADSIFVDERLAYTMSEPFDARYWMPCNDQPYDKAKADITVRVPEGFLVSSNGLLKSQTTVAGVTTFFWSDTTQIPTYLMVANASKFATYSDWYKRVSNPKDSIEVKYYVWPNDVTNEKTDGSKYNARHAFRNMVPMMEWYSTKLTEYPFVKYGMTAVQPYAFGGMEHQTMTTVSRRWLRGFDDEGIAHELMHQWTGDLVTCATFKDLWLNEGGAVWGEALWNESWGGKQAYINTLTNRRSAYINSEKIYKETPIYDAGSVVNLFNYQLAYVKPGWVYHMLRSMLGDEVFFPALQKYFNEHAYTSIETEDMIASFEKNVPNPPVPFRTFFDQWIYQAGHPVYVTNVNINPNGMGSFKASVRLRQTQSGANIPQVFVMPVKVTFRSNAGEEKTVIMLNNKRDQTEDFTLSFMPDIAVIDENDEILNEKTNVLVGIESAPGAYSDAVSISPNPLKAGEAAMIGYSLSKNQSVKIEVVNSIGQTVEVLKNEMIAPGKYQIPYAGNTLSSGMYTVRISSGSGIQALPFVVVR